MSLADAVRSLRMTDSETGGVALSSSAIRPSSNGEHFTRQAGVVEAAG